MTVKVFMWMNVTDCVYGGDDDDDDDVCSPVQTI